MRYAPISSRLAGLGGSKWEVHALAREMKSAGRDVIELTIGEPDVPCPPALIATAARAMEAGRLGYSNGRGEAGLLAALAARYTARRGRAFGPENFITLPGTQTALFAVLQTLLGPGDEILVGDPMYATYEGLIASTGARMVPVPLSPKHGFRMQAADVASRITPRTRVLFLNTPHNPTGSILRRDDIAALGALAVRHDLWIVSDEVYEELIFDGSTFVSPLDFPDLAERVVATASISKSHAAPGFRSGWCVGPAEFCARLLPLSETMLFGSQPFIADMTAEAVSHPSPVAPGMALRFARRADLLHQHLHSQNSLALHRPEAGMFALLDVRRTGLSGRDFALGLLREQGVACMPGESFGGELNGWLRLSLTQPDDLIAKACGLITTYVAHILGEAA